MSAQHNISSRTFPLEYGEMGVIALMFGLGAVCVYPSNVVTNFLIPEVLTSVAYSKAVGSALLVLSLIQACMLILRRLKGQSSGKTINLTFALVASLLVITYGIIFSWIGFYIATAMLIFTLSYFIDDEGRSIKASLLFTVVSLVVVTFLFKTFKIYLPPSLIF